MRGLRKQEGKKFEKFFDIVQKQASKIGCVFFLGNEEGNSFTNNEIECEDLFGWLIPADNADAFEKEFAESTPTEWDDFTCFVNWENVDNEITISFSGIG